MLTATLNDADADRLRKMGDFLRDKDSGVVAVLSSVKDGKITFLAVCGKDAVAKGIKAGDLVKQVSCHAAAARAAASPTAPWAAVQIFLSWITPWPVWTTLCLRSWDCNRRPR